MIARAISAIAARILTAVALAGAAVLVVVALSSIDLPPDWRLAPSALADPGGNGKGKGKGGENGNGGSSGQHGPGASSGSGDDDADDDDEAAASARQAGSAARSGRDYIPDEVVVANLEDAARADIRQLGFVVLDEQQLASLGLTITRLRVPHQMTAPTARTLLASRYPDVLVDLNAIYRPQGQLVLPPPDYPTKLIGWGHAPDVCGQGLRIGLLDTAVDAESPGLRGAHIVQRSFLPAGAEIASTEHGTAIASILVGQQSAGGGGLLPGAELAVAGAFGTDPDGIPIADVLALVGGLDWLVGSQAPVINMSFAGDANAVVALALRRVTAGHAIVVAAAGNGGPTAPPTFPADEPGVIGVTAVDNRSQPYADANRGDYIDFAAPGVRIWTPGPRSPGSYHTGTSFAAPFVTAAVAARLANDGATDADGIADALAMTAIDLGQPGKDPVFGRGLIQLANPCGQPTQ
jgi:Subtilase family